MFGPEMMGGGPPMQGGGDGPDSPDVAQALQDAADALQEALQGEEDPEDRAMIAKLLAQVHQIEAGHQKERDAAMGTSPAMKFVRRQSQGA